MYPTKPPPVSEPRDSLPSPIIFRVSLVSQVARLDPSEISQATSDGEPTIPREDCASTCLRAMDTHAGGIHADGCPAPKPYFAFSLTRQHSVYYRSEVEGGRGCNQRFQKNSLIAQVRNTYFIHLDGTLTTLVSGATLENAIRRWNAWNCVRPLSFQSNNHPILYHPQTVLLDKTEHYGRRPASDSQSRA